MSFALISRGYAANDLLCGIGQRGGELYLCREFEVRCGQ